MFQAAQVTQIEYLKSMPKVDIEKSLNLFGRSPSNDQGIFGSVDEGRRKQEPKQLKKKQKEQRVYGAWFDSFIFVRRCIFLLIFK